MKRKSAVAPKATPGHIALRLALLLTMPLGYLIRSDGKSEIVLIGVSVCAPFSESEQLRSHEEASGSNVETDQPHV